MAFTTIDDPSEYFETVLWTGNATGRNIAVNFQPDFVWTRNRDDATFHLLYDSTRGAGKALRSNSTNDESSVASDEITAFISTGFTIGTGDDVNANTEKILAWNWKANGGTTTTNDASATSVGNQDSVYQANTTAGFSIVTWDGVSQVGTMAHGLSAVPHVMIVKCRSTDGERWETYHHKNTSAPETDHLELSSTDATVDSTHTWNDTAPTSTIFTVNNSGALNENSKTYVAYLWSEKQGYSKFGGYTGNGSTDGTFVYTGFAPAWLMVKCTSGTKGWHIHDSKRPSYNPATNKLSAESNSVEGTGSEFTLDLLSNGFKCRSGDNEQNGDGDTYVYMAFAESPFTSSEGVPATAR